VGGAADADRPGGNQEGWQNGVIMAKLGGNKGHLMTSAVRLGADNPCCASGLK